MKKIKLTSKQSISLVLFLIINFTFVNAQCPELKSAYVDACDSPDGKGEFILLKTGTSTLNISDITLEIDQNSDGTSEYSFCPSGCTDKWLAPTTSSISSLNGNCLDNPFIGVGPGDVVPANTYIIIFTNKNFKDDADWSGLCGETIYVTTIKNVNNSDKYPHNTGSSTGTATVKVSFSSNAGCNISNTYDVSQLAVEATSGSGGPTVIWDNGSTSYNNLGCGGFSLTALSTSSVSLPVEMISFNAFENEKTNELVWIVANQLNNYGFEIERSTNGLDFYNIGEVLGDGTLAGERTFTFIDELPNEDINYYRLKQIDFDGQFAYSDVVNLKNESIEKIEVNIFPNPAQNRLNISNITEGTASVYNSFGQLVRELEFSYNNDFDISELPSGNYYLKINGVKDTEVLSFIKL